MNQAEVIEIIREGLLVMVTVSAPCLIVALVVGVLISLLQAVTQLQEATLTFVPKMLAVFLTLVIVMPFMMSKLINYTQQLYSRFGQM